MTRSSGPSRGAATTSWSTEFVGPWFLPPFRVASEHHHLAMSYVVLRPDLETTLVRAEQRVGRELKDVNAITGLHAAFEQLEPSRTTRSTPVASTRSRLRLKSGASSLQADTDSFESALLGAVYGALHISAEVCLYERGYSSVAQVRHHERVARLRCTPRGYESYFRPRLTTGNP